MNLKKLLPQHHITKARFKPYSYVLEVQDERYHIFFLNVSKRHLLTINSKTIWELKSGSFDGSRFQARSKQLMQMGEFMKLPRKILLCKSEPYKILKVINESEVEDITNQSEFYDVKLYTSLETFIKTYEQNGTND